MKRQKNESIGMFIPCTICGKKAEWVYMPGTGNYCDKCVPRGCSCNINLKDGIDYDSEEAKLPENYVEKLDEKGRRYPCCEYWELTEDSHQDMDHIKDAWTAYYEYNEKNKTKMKVIKQ
jgi:hypothetical protein